jgi:hypothetical protein
MFRYERVSQEQIGRLKANLPAWGFEVFEQATNSFGISGHGVTGFAVYDSRQQVLVVDRIEKTGFAIFMPDSIIDGRIKEALGIS